MRSALLLIGAAACWTQPASPPASLPVPVKPMRVIADPPRFDPLRCELDAVPETLCGASDAGGCGPTGKTLVAIEASSAVPVTGFPIAAEAADGFLFDAVATARRFGACCYSRCTSLAVGPAAIKFATAPDQWIGAVCLPAPPAGTAQPVPSNSACPIGVALGGEPCPYVSGSESTCCYQRLVTVPGWRPEVPVRADLLSPDMAALHRARPALPAPLVSPLGVPLRLGPFLIGPDDLPHRDDMPLHGGE